MEIKLVVRSLFLLAVVVAYASCQGSYSSSRSLDYSISIRSRFASSTSIEFEITAPCPGWYGFGFGTSMTNCDMFIIEASSCGAGTGTITDTYSVGQSNPPTDTTSNYNIATAASGSNNIYTVTRDLNTGDSAQDYTIVDGSNNIIYSSTSSSTIVYHGAGNYAAFSIVVDSSGQTVSLSSGSLDVDTENATIHGLLLYFAWGVFSLILVVSGRYFKYFYAFRIYVHSFVAIVVLIFNIIAIAEYGNSSRPRPSVNKLGDKHESLGGAVTIWTIATIILGIVAKILQKFIVHKSQLAKYSRWGHIIIAYLLLIYTHIVILSGLFFFDSPVTYLYYIHLACMILLYATVEVIFQLKSQWKYSDLKSLESKELKTISFEEFQQCIKDGKKYALFDNYVLDLTWYRHEHPGSSYLIEANIGKDMGKYFIGSYSMENGVPVHTHSYMAGKILKKLVCAKIEDSPQKILVNDKSFSPDSAERMMEKELMASSNPVFYVKDKDELLPSVFRFKFANDTTLVKGFYSGLELSGRSYMINSLQNQVCRYYTICNCMSSKFYDHYIACFNSILEEKSDYESMNYDEILEANEGQIEIVAKYYHQTKRGISAQLTNATQEDQFYINTPVGKGLDLNLESPNGTHILFVGGTGILPYMDFFAYMARHTISKQSGKEVFAGEKFDHDLSGMNLIIYAYYRDEANAVGYEFTSRVDQIYKHYKLDNQFTFIPKFTKFGEPRLNKKSLLEILEKQKESTGIEKIWVCGPPSMNNLFYRFIGTVSKAAGIDKSRVDVL